MRESCQERGQKAHLEQDGIRGKCRRCTMEKAPCLGNAICIRDKIWREEQGTAYRGKGVFSDKNFFIFDLEFHFHICYTFPHIMFVQCFGLRGLVGHRCKYALK